MKLCWHFPRPSYRFGVMATKKPNLYPGVFEFVFGRAKHYEHIVLYWTSLYLHYLFSYLCFLFVGEKT